MPLQQKARLSRLNNYQQSNNLHLKKFLECKCPLFLESNFKTRLYTRKV